MRFRMVRLSFVRTRRARGIEISQAGVAQPVNPMEPRQHALDQQFRLSIGVGWPQRIVLFDRSAFRIAVQRGRRGEDEDVDPRGEHRFEKRQRICRIVPKKLRRRLHRFAGLDQCRKMHDGFDRVRTQHRVQTCALGEFARHEFGVLGHRLPMPPAQVIEHHNLMPCLE